jgi:hypothetical protein
MSTSPGSPTFKGNERAFAIAAVLGAALVALALWAAISGSTGSTSSSESGAAPVTLEPYSADDSGSSAAAAGAEVGVQRVVLTGRAVGRIGLQTATVSTQGAGAAKRMVVPFSAVLYDADGVAWVYTNPESLVYIRQRITIDRVTGDEALLSKGPEAGTTVVTAGTAQLFGAEIDFGKG